MNWRLDGYVLKYTTIELRHIPEYNIEMTDYISVDSGHLVRIDFKNVFEIIAVEMMYRDLGETMETMEEKLDDLGITGIYPASELLKHFDESALLLSKQFKIGDSPYAARNLSDNIEYFGTQRFKTKYYRDIVGYSVKHALTIIAKSILSKLQASNIDYKLCSLNDNGVYFITNYANTDLDIILGDSVNIRAFGRRFEVKPKVTVF